VRSNKQKIPLYPPLEKGEKKGDLKKGEKVSR